MKRKVLIAAALASGAALAAAAAPAWSQPAQRPAFETRKVEGTDNVYIFRYGNRQSMFVVTSAGVIATDPIGYGVPPTVPTYIAEIRKVTDKTVDKKKTLKLGDTTLELTYLGLNHSDSSLVMRLPKEKVLFLVDFIPVGSVPCRGMIDFYPLEAEQSIKQVLAMDWKTLNPAPP